ncbi:hypothetical protein D4Z78_06710 [Okeania hirsuta]|nr:hypothetical protein D4Z78_06710 [Okeania hirsuta]
MWGVWGVWGDGEMERWGYRERCGNGAQMEHFFIPNPKGFDITPTEMTPLPKTRTPCKDTIRIL